MNISDYVPFILKEEESRICQEIEGKQLCVIFDGTSGLLEALTIVLHYINNDFSIQ